MVATHTMAATMVTRILLTITVTGREDITAATTVVSMAMGAIMVMAAITAEEEGFPEEEALVAMAEDTDNYHNAIWEALKHSSVVAHLLAPRKRSQASLQLGTLSIY